MKFRSKNIQKPIRAELKHEKDNFPEKSLSAGLNMTLFVHNSPCEDEHTFFRSTNSWKFLWAENLCLYSKYKREKGNWENWQVFLFLCVAGLGKIEKTWRMEIFLSSFLIFLFFDMRQSLINIWPHKLEKTKPIKKPCALAKEISKWKYWSVCFRIGFCLLFIEQPIR